MLVMLITMICLMWIGESVPGLLHYMEFIEKLMMGQQFINNHKHLVRSDYYGKKLIDIVWVDAIFLSH